MAATRGGVDDAGMPRLVVLWTCPYDLSVEEAQAWACREAKQLLGLEVVQHAKLTRLQSASERHARSWDWMLELQLAADADRGACINAGACAVWVSDLRQLGLRPTVFLADGGIELLAEHHG